MKFFQAICIVLVFLVSCKKDSVPPPEELTEDMNEPTPSLALTEGTSYLVMDTIDYVFYPDVSYGTSTLQTFDVFLPNTPGPHAAVIYFHGGGFIAGDKSEIGHVGTISEMVQQCLYNDIAFITVNYRLIVSHDAEGVIKPLSDCKYALQFIRHYCSDLTIEPNDIVLSGISAGGGTVLWLGLNDDRADPLSTDPVKRQSTRVKGLMPFTPQASYDIAQWHNDVFLEYQPVGFDYEWVRDLMTTDTLSWFYGVNSEPDIFLPENDTYRDKVNMILKVSSDDPEIYCISRGVQGTPPLDNFRLAHHPLHATTIMNMADAVGLDNKFFIPQMGIDTRDGEEVIDFILRKLQ